MNFMRHDFRYQRVNASRINILKEMWSILVKISFRKFKKDEI